MAVQPRQHLSKRNKRLIRLAAVLVGGAIGQVCPLLPVEKQIICHWAAKLISLVAGGTP